MKHLFIINPAAGSRDRTKKYKEIIRSKDETIHSKDKAIKIMGGMLIGVFVVILLVLIIDVLNGGFGFVRY